MTLTENDRYHLHQQLEAALDERGANTMMELLPPVGWADVATKRDLDQLGERMDLRFDKAAESTNLRFDKAADNANLRFDKAAENTNLRFDNVDVRFDAIAARIVSKLLTVLVPVIAVAVVFLTAVSVGGPG